MAHNQPETTFTPDQRARPRRTWLAHASVVVVATVGVAFVEVDAGNGASSPSRPNATTIARAPKPPDLTDPTTRQRFVESFAPGYFNQRAAAFVEVGAGNGASSPARPSPTTIVRVPKLPDLTDPTTRQRFVESFGPGYFNQRAASLK